MPRLKEQTIDVLENNFSKMIVSVISVNNNLFTDQNRPSHARATHVINGIILKFHLFPGIFK